MSIYLLCSYIYIYTYPFKLPKPSKTKNHVGLTSYVMNTKNIQKSLNWAASIHNLPAVHGNCLVLLQKIRRRAKIVFDVSHDSVVHVLVPGHGGKPKK